MNRHSKLRKFSGKVMMVFLVWTAGNMIWKAVEFGLAGLTPVAAFFGGLGLALLSIAWHRIEYRAFNRR